jgi:hypothetical protein
MRKFFQHMRIYRPVIVHTRFDLPEAHYWSKLGNVHVTPIDDSSICADTPAEKFHQKFMATTVKTSRYGIAELSDLLRSCIIYKFGGTYVDSDIILFKPFPDQNFVAKQDGDPICSIFDLDKGDIRLKQVLNRSESGYNPGK